MPLYTRSRTLRLLEGFTLHSRAFPPESRIAGSNMRAHLKTLWTSFSALGGTCSLKGGAVADDLEVADTRDRRFDNGAE